MTSSDFKTTNFYVFAENIKIKEKITELVLKIVEIFIMNIRSQIGDNVQAFQAP